MKARRAAFVGTLALVATTASGCGGEAKIRRFTTDWVDDGGKSFGLLWDKLANVHPAVGADIAVGVPEGAAKLVGLPLGQGARWTYDHALDARPLVAGSIVAGTGGGELFALDAATGRKLWARPTGGLRVDGVGDDGTVTVVTLSRGTGLGSTLLAIGRDGNVMQQIETARVLGCPAVLGGYAFVPWNGVYVSAIDLSTGSEMARVVLRDQTTRAWTEGGQLYFGGIAIVRFDEHIKGADKSQATHVALPVHELAGAPKLMEPGAENPGPMAQARDRIRLYARPAADDAQGLGLDSRRYFATYFKLAMGLDSTKASLAWVHTHASDVIGGAAAAGALVLCDEQGHVTTLDARTGGVVADVDLGEKVGGCVVQVDGYRASADPAAMPPLAAQIAEAILNRDAQLATAKKLLLRELSTLEDESVTKTLIALASDERTSPLILDDARKALADRRNGAPYMIEALSHHYDFLKDVLRPPPVGPMAQALAAMGQKGAAPLLASHLLDPADTDDDVRRAAEALVVLAGPTEAPQLTQFFSIYRAAAPAEDVETAVVSAAQALVKVAGADAQARVAAAMHDGLTLPNVRERLSALVTLAPAASPEADAGAHARDAGKPKRD